MLTTTSAASRRMAAIQVRPGSTKVLFKLSRVQCSMKRLRILWGHRLLRRPAESAGRGRADGGGPPRLPGGAIKPTPAAEDDVLIFKAHYVDSANRIA